MSAAFKYPLCGLMVIAFSCFAPATQAYPRPEEIARGHQVLIAGDCMACHTDAEGKELAGNRPIKTPFGTIYSSNITPDVETGIGGWTPEQFYRAMHEGIDDRGQHLYPAMPYTYYTKLSRSDVDALFAYLKTVAPVRNEVKDPDLMWPLGWRSMMAIWNKMYFTEGQYQYDAQHSATWNRGAYLVNGPGHCGACHTEKNFLGADNTSKPLQGGELQNWFAPVLIANTRNGLGSWKQEDIVEFLSTGRNSTAAAYGPMSEVITDSTSQMNIDDLNAIAEYLKTLPVAGNNNGASSVHDSAAMRAGQDIFSAQCSACHQVKGEGVHHAFAALQGDANVQQRRADTLIQAVLTGVRAVPTSIQPTGFAMPAYNWKLNDAQIAAVLTYVRNSWGNAASPVTASQVRSVREAISSGDD